MLIDIHTHLVNPNFNLKEYKANFAENMLLKKVNYTNFENYIIDFLAKLHQSKLDKAVLIGINDSKISANNEQVLTICKKHSEFLYGVNLNPLDNNIETQIKEAISNKAVLVKILPSFQKVNLDDDLCIPFFELLKEYNLPLLVHTGREYTLKSSNQDLNNPIRLEKAAKIGVKIICAHCGTRIFLHEKNFFKNWINLALKYENVYGDLSAMLTPVQMFDLRKLVKNAELKNKVVFGTDYPAFPFTLFKKSAKNSFIDSYNYLEKLGFDDNMYKLTERLLNL